MTDDGDMKLVCKSEYPAYSKARSNATALVSLFAPDVADEKRAPVSVTLVLDKSGSMAGSNIRLVKETCKFLLQQLGPRDTVSVISYSTEAGMDHQLVAASAENKESVSVAIDGIQASGSTNLSGGLFMGLTQQLNNVQNAAQATPEQGEEGSKRKATIQSVFLFTDGQANQGLRTLSLISTTLTNMLTANGRSTSPAPIKIHTFGFGSNHDATLLQGIANSGNGTYYYIESAESIPETFADALGGLLSVFAQNVELTISAVLPNTIKQVHTGYTKRAEGSSTVVALPDVFAEERRDIVVNLELHPVEAEGQGSILEAKVSYINIVSGQMISREATLSVNRAELVLHAGMVADEEVVMHRTRLDIAGRLQRAVQLADDGRFDEADSLLSEQVNVLNNLVIEDGDDDDSDTEMTATPRRPQHRAVYLALRQDVDRARGDMRYRSQWSAGGRNFTVGSMRSHAAQRSTGISYRPPSNAPLGAPPGLAPMAQRVGPMHTLSEGLGAPDPNLQRSRRGLLARLLTRNRSRNTEPSGAAPAPPYMDRSIWADPPPPMMAPAQNYAAPASAAYPPPPGLAETQEGSSAAVINPYANSQQRRMVTKSKSVMGP